MADTRCSVSSLPADFEAEVPADGRVGRTKHPHHGVWQEEQDPRLLPVVAENENLQNRRSE